MKKIKKITFIFLLIGFSFTVTVAQIQKTPKENTLPEVIKSVNAGDYKEWQKIDLKSFSFYAPKELKRIKQRCIDSDYCDRFEGKDFALSIDISPSPYLPSYEKKFPSYREKFFWLDGAFGWFWSFEDTSRGYKYFAGVRFKFPEDKNFLLAIGVGSKDTDIKETAEKIFKSVQFKDKKEKVIEKPK